MSVGITDLAHSIRKRTADTAVPVLLSRAQQLVCAAFGHKSLASFQAAHAAEQEPHSFDGLAHAVPDYQLVHQRAQELGLELPAAQLQQLIEAAFAERLPATRVHRSLGALAGDFQDELQAAVLDDGAVSSAMASANYDGIEEVYLEEEVDPNLATVDEPAVATISGHITLGIDTERQYVGHKVQLQVAAKVVRCGRRCFEKLQIEVLSAGLEQDWDDAEHDDEPPRKTLAQALAVELNIDVSDAEELVDVEAQELTGHSGDMTYGYLFDFTDEASPELAAKLMQQHGSLKLEVGPWFFEGVGD